MIKSSIEQLAEPIGFDIANSDDNVQANLINGLGRGFKLYNDQNFNMQLCYLSNKLNKDAEKFILELAEYIKSKNT
jgi:hypothetical protein